MMKLCEIRKPLSKRSKKRIKCLLIFLTVFLICCVLFVFIGIPLIFMESIELQRLIMFTNLNLPHEESYFRKFQLKPGLRNMYVSVRDRDTHNLVSLGVWQLLPHSLTNISVTDPYFNYDQALRHSNNTVLLYFHGTGEDRSSSLSKYDVLRISFHVITFDYRSYGDSTEATLSEDAVVNDCVQLYDWLSNKTSAPIMIWGHSLGSAIAAKTAALLSDRTPRPIGLVLESAFTSMREELYVHPYGKLFAWLPWFEATILIPLEKNGFLFETRMNVLNVKSPVMILAAEDDSIVPYRFGFELYNILKNQSRENTTFYHQFPYYLGYNHNFIYDDWYLPIFIE